MPNLSELPFQKMDFHSLQERFKREPLKVQREYLDIPSGVLIYIVDCMVLNDLSYEYKNEGLRELPLPWPQEMLDEVSEFIGR